MFVEDKDYSNGLQYLTWRSEIGDWRYDNLTSSWRLSELQSAKIASIILVFNAKTNGTFINNVSSGVGNKKLLNASNNTKVYDPRLIVDKIALNESVEIGEKAIFEIIVKNTGDMDLNGVYVLESKYGSGLVYLDFYSIKGNWIHSLNDEKKHIFILNESLKVGDSARFCVVFNTTETGNYTNFIEAGYNNTTVCNATNSTKVVNTTNPYYPQNGIDLENGTDEGNVSDYGSLIGDGFKAGKNVTGNPLIALLVVLVIIPFRRFKF